VKPCRLRKRTGYSVRQEVTQKPARRAILLVAGAVLFVFAIPYFHMVDTGGSGTVCRRILPAYDPHEPLALEAAVLADDGEWKRCNERYHGRDDPTMIAP
jgi:hypothetical protein